MEGQQLCCVAATGLDRCGGLGLLPPSLEETRGQLKLQGVSQHGVLAALIYLLSPMNLPDEPLLYLIGVHHVVQFKPAITQMIPSGEIEAVRQKREAFKAHVAEMIDKLDIEIVAEEFSDEGKKESEARAFAKDFAEKTAPEQQFDWETELQKFSKAKDIEHCFCDPNSEERKALGIEDPDSERGRAQREQEWLLRIADCKDRRVLFVCGDTHYDAFAQLLATNSFNVWRGPHYDRQRRRV